jgi:4-diphosphocytidyl-2-C-methyl-D-erythritol kinase
MITRYAYAKINLGLRILGKRADGFHDIETVLHRIDLYDELSFAKSETLSLEYDSPALPLGQENLCIGLRASSVSTGVQRGAHTSRSGRIFP